MNIKFSKTEADAIAQIGRIAYENNLECGLFIRQGGEWALIERPGINLMDEFSKYCDRKLHGVDARAEVIK